MGIGFGSVAQAGVSERVKEQLGVSAPLAVPASRPLSAQLRNCYPARARVSEYHVWRPVSSVDVGDSVAVVARLRLHPIAFSTTRAEVRARVAAASGSVVTSVATPTPCSAVPAVAPSDGVKYAVAEPIASRTRARTRAARLAESS